MMTTLEVARAGCAIKRFQVGGEWFVYDSATNLITPERNCAQTTGDSLPSVEVPPAEYPMQSGVLDTLCHSERHMLSLAITENCNLRCAYCIYSGKWADRRGHSRATMAPDTAFAAVRDFLLHSENAKRRWICFYGGEPLLCKDLIQLIMRYVQSDQEGTLRFRITTNGTLLDLDTYNKFLPYEVLYQVSIDGDAETHDRYRRTAHGEPTHELAMTNLRKIADAHPDTFLRDFFVSITLAPPVRYTEIEDWVATEPLIHQLFRNGSISMTSVDPTWTSLHHPSYCSVEWWPEAGEIRPMRMELLRELMRYPDQKMLFADAALKSLVPIHKREISEGRRSTFCPSGNCVAGVQRCYVNARGDIYPCERGPEAKCVKIGTAETGVSSQAVARLLNRYVHLSLPECMSCWAYRLCTQCSMQCVKSGRLTRDMGSCDEVRLDRQHDLIDYVTFVQEFGAKAVAMLDAFPD